MRQHERGEPERAVGIAAQRVVAAESSAAQTTPATRLCVYGYQVKASGVTAVIPGSIATRSQPSRRKTGHTPSTSCAASTSVPSEGRGATFFAASASPKWPMNIRRRFAN